jgi:hypothetical protein
VIHECATFAAMSDAGPFVVVTAILDGAARAAAVTRCHGEAMERAVQAVQGCHIAGLDLIELAIAPQTHAALRRYLELPADQVGVYDLFPLSPTLSPEVRRAAAQFLAAEALWTFDAQGALKGAPLSVKLDLPSGWDKDPKQVHERLVAAGALDLSEQAITSFLSAKQAWTTLGG